MIGKVVGTPSLGRVKNGQATALILRVCFGDSDDIRKVQYFPGSGVDDVPVEGSVVAVEEHGAVLAATGAYDMIISAAGQGERELYSSQSGAKKARVKCKKNGTVFIGSETNSTNLGTELSTLMSGLASLASALSAFSAAAALSSTDPVLAAAAASLETSLTTISSSLATVKTGLAAVLDGSA
jgi:hypothetical protein